MNVESQSITGKNKLRFEALQHCLVPRSRSFDENEKARSEQLIAGVLSQQAPANVRKIGLFLFIIDVVSFLMAGRVFKALDDPGQQRIMQFFMNAPIGLLRKGFWGVNSLAKLGVYGQTELYAEIGYKLKENPGADTEV